MTKEYNQEHKAPLRQQARGEAAASQELHPLLTLGRQVGNAAIGRMLAQRASPEEEELQLARDPDAQRAALDEDEDDDGLRASPEEEELQLARDPDAQRAALDEDEDDDGLRASPEEEELQMARDPDAQRAALDDDEDDDALRMSRAAPEVGPEGGPVSEPTAARIASLRGGGSALDDGTRAQMEQSLGADFADVRVHTGAEAAQLNRSLGAKAFTTGSDVFFGQGPGAADKGLLAHELTHVVQQRGMSPGGPLTVGPADNAYEAEAEAAATAVSSGAAPAQRDANDEGS